MKTKGMKHQEAALRALRGRAAFALFMEMGTGKTWTALADAERLYNDGRIRALLVIAPRGVHTNWVRREIPEHLSAPHIAAAYISGATSKKYQKSIDALYATDLDPPPLRILSINYEALITKDGRRAALRFLNAGRRGGAMIVVDESVRIKTPTAASTKAVLDLADLGSYRRILSGLPVTNAPPDLFSQMEFLGHGLLGTSSYRAFVAEYAELLPPGHGLMRHIAERAGPFAAPQIVARNADGTPKWRNLDLLQQRIAPHSFRVLKRDCLDLPEKIYTTHPFSLSAQQRKHYERLQHDLVIQIEEEGLRPQPVSRLAALMKLQQITSGFVILSRDDPSPRLVDADKNPRMDALMDVIGGLDPTAKFIIWARFREEINQIVAKLAEANIPAAAYHSGVGSKAREDAIDGFQNGAIRAFIGQPQAGGIGLTLTAAQVVIYYSNDFNYGTRAQSEDRAHRIGTRRNVVYVDLIAVDTVDEAIVRTLQRKEDVATLVMGDDPVQKLFGESPAITPIRENSKSLTQKGKRA